jgi:hypothetical protein
MHQLHLAEICLRQSRISQLLILDSDATLDSVTNLRSLLVGESLGNR